MNPIEKFVYDKLKGNPRLKLFVRNSYQSVFDLLPRKRDWSIAPIEVKSGYFFGFHDISPFSQTDDKVLANKLAIPLRKPMVDDPLIVGYFTFDNQCKDFNKIGESFAWNYHKGCRLQWAGKDKIIYNDALNGKLISRVYSTESSETTTLPYPIDSINAEGTIASFFSYERLEKLMPGYGYPHQDDYSFLEENAPDKTGIYTMRMEDGSIQLLKSVKELSEMSHVPETVKNEMFFVTHSLFSPDGQFLSFMLRSTTLDNLNKRWSSLIVMDLNTEQCFVAPTEEMVSHYVWNARNQIVAYYRVDGIDSHILFEDPTLANYKRVAYPFLNSDGHQSFASDEVFVTDTYPDKYRMANLFKVDMSNNKITKLATLNSPKMFQSRSFHSACDLHPRMNRKGDVICFDSIHTGMRSLCFMNIS